MSIYTKKELDKRQLHTSLKGLRTVTKAHSMMKAKHNVEILLFLKRKMAKILYGTSSSVMA